MVGAGHEMRVELLDQVPVKSGDPLLSDLSQTMLEGEDVVPYKSFCTLYGDLSEENVTRKHLKRGGRGNERE